MRIKGKKFTYSVKMVKLPNGKTTTIDFVEHPGAALIMPLLNKRQTIFLRQYRAALGKYLYELPAGTLNKRENPLVCARRELVEETGYSARRFRALGKIYPVPGYSDEVIFIYQATDLRKAQANPDHDEILKPFVVSRKEVIMMFKRGQIKDAKTICALALAGWL